MRRRKRRNGLTEHDERIFSAGEQALPNRKRDYEAIKRLRHIRNLIGHQTGSSGCTEADFNDLQRIHLRFLQHEDPLLLLEKAEYNAEKDAAEGQRAAADAAFAAAPQQTLRRKAKGQSALRMAAVILLLFVMALAAAGIAAIIFMFA